MPASDLQANPENWRRHPKAQRDAMAGMLREIGYADALLARETADGALMLIDGHLRKEVTPDQVVPVLVLDVTEGEARTILAALDPLAGMAEPDTAAMDALLQRVRVTDADLTAMLAGVASDMGITPPDFAPEGVDGQGRLDQKKPVICPECGHEFTA